MSEWQSIESAPRDRDVIVYNAMTGVYGTRFDDGEWPLRNWGGAKGIWYPQPSHWMPLPEAPE